MFNQAYDEILGQIANYFAAKQYHLIIDNLKIAVEVLEQDAKEAVISTENKKQLEDLLCKVLPFLDRQMQEKEWHRILRDLALQANEILKSQRLGRIILSHLREDVVYPELYQQHKWPEVVCGCEEILALSKKTLDLHRSLQDPEAAKYPQLINIIGNYHLLKIIFKYYAVVALEKMPAEAREQYKHFLASWLGNYIEQLLQLEEYIQSLEQEKRELFSTDHYWEIVHHYQHLLRCDRMLPQENGLQLLQQLPRTSIADKISALQLALNLLKRYRKCKATETAEAITQILQEIIAINKAITTKSEIIVDSLRYREELASAQSRFLQSPTIEGQKDFSAASRKLLENLFSLSVKLLGPAACASELFLYGSSAREDRFLRSDLEIGLMHSNVVNSDHVPIEIYCALIYAALDFITITLGETLYIGINIYQGFCLDSSTDGLHGPKIDLPVKLLQERSLQQLADNITVLDEECVYMLLQPMLVNIESGGILFKDYQTCLTSFLNQPAPENQWQHFALQFKLPFKVPPQNLTYRQLIALYCFYNVIRQSVTLPDLKNLNIVDLKTNYLKPIIYLALNLKLYFGLASVHPYDILREAESRLTELQQQDEYRLFPWQLIASLRKQLPQLLMLRCAAHSRYHEDRLHKVLEPLKPDLADKTTLTAPENAVLDNAKKLLEILSYQKNTGNSAQETLVLLPIEAHLSIMLRIDFVSQLQQLYNMLSKIQVEASSNTASQAILSLTNYRILTEGLSLIKNSLNHLHVLLAWTTEIKRQYSRLIKELKILLHHLQITQLKQNTVAQSMLLNGKDLQKLHELCVLTEKLIANEQEQYGCTEYHQVLQKSIGQFDVMYNTVLQRQIRILLLSHDYQAIEILYDALPAYRKEQCWRFIAEHDDAAVIAGLKKVLRRYPTENGFRPEIDAEREHFERALIAAVSTEAAGGTADICGAGFFAEAFIGKMRPEVLTELAAIPSLLQAPKSADIGYNHLVKEVTLDSKAYYFKFFPEFPGFDLAVSRLYELIIGYGVAKSMLIKINIDGKNYPVLISEKIPGERFDSYLAHDPNPTLSAENFTELLIMTFLSVPEDGKPNNYIWQDGIPICIDGGRAFGQPICEDKYLLLVKIARVMMKTIFFCSEQMKSQLNAAAVKRFLALNTKAILDRLLQDLNQYHTSLQKFFTEKELQQWAQTAVDKRKYNQMCCAYIQFPPEAINNFYQQMTLLQELLRRDPTQMPTKLLYTLLPFDVADYYNHLLNDFATLKDRFGQIALRYYDGATSKVPSTMLLSQSYSKPLTAANTVAETFQSLTVCREHLSTITEQYQSLLLVKNAVEIGDMQPLLLLPPILQLRVIKMLDWRLVPKQIQPKVLNRLTVAPCANLCTKICLAYCDLLDDALLLKILQKVPNLQILELYECKGIMGASLFAKLPPTVLPQLKKIRIQSCANLKQLVIPNLPYLDAVIVKNCRALEVIGSTETTLKEIVRVYDCENLSQVNGLGVLDIARCPKIKLEEIFSSYKKPNAEVIAYLKALLQSGNYEYFMQIIVNIKEPTKEVLSIVIESLGHVVCYELSKIYFWGYCGLDTDGIAIKDLSPPRLELQARAIACLKAALTHSNREIRWHAGCMLWKLNVKDFEFPDWGRALNDKEAVGQIAWAVLGQRESLSLEAIDVLITYLNDDMFKNEAEAILFKHGNKNQEVIARLRAALTHSNREICWQIGCMLWKLNVMDFEFPDWKRALNDKEAVSQIAWSVLKQQESLSREAIDVLITCLNDYGPRRAETILLKHVDNNLEVIARLRIALVHENKEMRWQAGRLLWKLNIIDFEFPDWGRALNYRGCVDKIAWSVLRQSENLSREAIEALIPYLIGNYKTIVDVVVILLEHAEKNPEVIACLRAALVHKNKELCWEAGCLLWKLKVMDFEFPDLIGACYYSSSSKIALSILKQRKHLSQEIIDTVFIRLRNGWDRDTSEAILLEHAGKNQEIIARLRTALVHEDKEIRWRAGYILWKLNVTDFEFPDLIGACYSIGSCTIVLSILKQRENLSQEMIDGVIACLVDYKARSDAEVILLKHASENPEVVARLRAALAHENKKIRCGAWCTLWKLNITDFEFPDLVEALKYSADSRKIASSILRQRENLSQEMIDAVITCLSDFVARDEVEAILLEHAGKNLEVITRLRVALGHKEIHWEAGCLLWKLNVTDFEFPDWRGALTYGRDVSKIAWTVLELSENLSREAIDAMITHLNDYQTGSEAKAILLKHASKNPEVVASLRVALIHENKEIRCEAGCMLWKLNVTDFEFPDLVETLKYSADSCKIASSILKKRENLSQRMIDGVIACLGRSCFGRDEVEAILLEHVGKNPEVIARLRAALAHENEEIRCGARCILWKLNVTDFEFPDLLKALNYEYSCKVILSILKQRESLSQEMIDGLIECLRYSYARKEAEAILLEHANARKNPEVIVRLRTALVHENKEIRCGAGCMLWKLNVMDFEFSDSDLVGALNYSEDSREIASSILKKRENLSQEMIEGVIACLEYFWVRSEVEAILFEHGSKNPEIIARLRVALVHKNKEIRCGAGCLLWKLNVMDFEFPDWGRALTNGGDVSKIAWSIIGQRENLSQNMIDGIITYLGNLHPLIRSEKEDILLKHASKNPEVIAHLRAALVHEKKEIRWEAGCMLWKLNVTDFEFPDVKGMFHDRMGVAKIVLSILKQREYLSQEMIEEVIICLTLHLLVRDEAKEVLLKHGHKNPEVIACLRVALGHENKEMCLEAGCMLWKLNVMDFEFSNSDLVGALSHSTDSRKIASSILKQRENLSLEIIDEVIIICSVDFSSEVEAILLEHANRNREVISRLKVALTHEDEEIRCGAWGILWKLNITDFEFPNLAMALNYECSRKVASSILKQQENLSQEMIDGVIECFGYSEACDEAEAILLEHAGKNREIVARLITALTHESKWVYWEAGCMLWRLNITDFEFLDLGKALENEEVSKDIFQALSGFERLPQNIITAALSTNNELMHQFIAEHLHKIAVQFPEQAIAILTPLLTDKYDHIRMAAVAKLQQLLLHIFGDRSPWLPYKVVYKIFSDAHSSISTPEDQSWFWLQLPLVSKTWCSFFRSVSPNGKIVIPDSSNTNTDTMSIVKKT